MTLSQLRFVRPVVDAGSFTGSAARCDVTQPPLSPAFGYTPGCPPCGVTGDKRHLHSGNADPAPAN